MSIDQGTMIAHRCVGAPGLPLVPVERHVGSQAHSRHFRNAVLVAAFFITALTGHPAVAQDGPSDQTTNTDAEQPATTGDEPDDMGLLELEIPVVVTAARREQKITHVPHAISVITANDIRRAGARSIPDALRLVPGVDVADLAFGTSAVAPRGFHGFLARQVLVLVDGRQIFDSLFGGTLWGSWPFQLEDIERIEVIRGPGGVTWGANAVNGVINIITKDPADQLGRTVTLRGGSRGSFKTYVGYAATDEKLSLRISGEYEASDGFRTGGSILRDLADDYKAGRASLYGITKTDAGDTLTFSAGSAVVDGAYPPMPLAGLGLKRNSGSQASFVLATWSHRISDRNKVEVTGYVNDFFASPGLPSIDYRYQQLALQFSHSFVPRENHEFSWGIDTRLDLLDATNADPFMLSKGFVSTGVIGIYARDQWAFAPRWSLDLGARLDYEFYGGFQPSARGSLSYALGDTGVVYAAISRAFQMPSAGLRFIDIPLLNGLARATGRRDVDAETLVAYEIGYRDQPFENFEASLNLFWHEFSDLTTLSPRIGPPGLIRMDLDNRADASLCGVEIDATYRASPKLTLLGHYTFQHLDWRSSSPFHEKDSMTPPEHKFMIGARYSPTDDLHLSTHLYYVDSVQAPNPANPFMPRTVDAYFRLDLRGEYEFSDDRASIAVGVQNLLDSDHYEGGTLFLNDAEVPRMVYAEVRLTIR